MLEGTVLDYKGNLKTLAERAKDVEAPLEMTALASELYKLARALDVTAAIRHQRESETTTYSVPLH